MTESRPLPIRQLPISQLDVLHVFSSFAVGGAQVRFAALANHFGDAAKHRIIAMDGNRDARTLIHGDIDVYYPKLGIGRTDTLGNWGRIRRYLRKTPPHVLITSNWGTIDWAIARQGLGVRHIHMEDGFGPEERDRQIFRRVMTRRLVLRGSQILLPSRTVEQIALKTWGLPKRNLNYVPNGVDTARFANAAPAALPPGEGPVFGTVTALRAEKNLHRLLEAFAAVRATRPARLVIVGDGPVRNDLQRAASQLNIAPSVIFTGHSATPENYLASFDVFTLSSDTEQMPLCVLEAAASSLPVAATDVGDVKAILAPANAPFVVPRDAAALGKAMLALIDNRELATQIGNANRALAAAQFSEEAMFAAHWRLWTGAK